MSILYQHNDECQPPFLAWSAFPWLDGADECFSAVYMLLTTIDSENEQILGAWVGWLGESGIIFVSVEAVVGALGRPTAFQE